MDFGTAELLAPAGSYESLIAAVNAGADAVYIGGPKFGARAYADNPDEDGLLRAIEYAHLYGVRVHLTVNTLLKDRELEELPSYIRPYYEAGLDAAIVQDLGAFAVLHRHFPLLSLHASTQTAVTGPESGLFYRRLGAVRLIPARELSLDEIRELKKRTGLEIETFVHGSLCYSYSGQCFMSSLIGGRSGNRGRCAQPCRFPYELLAGGTVRNRREDVCLLSCKDLCSLDLVPALIGAGIDSFKIEGRMKSARYTAGVVSVWRKYLDMYRKGGPEAYHVDAADRKKLLDLFDRGGQTDGYYFEYNGPDMIAMHLKPKFRKGNPALNEELEQKYVEAERTLPIRGEAFFSIGAPMRLSVEADLPEGTVCASAEGPVPERAKKSGALADKTEERLRKTGGTAFVFENLSVHLEPGLFLPVSQVNELRRNALENLKQEILKKGRERKQNRAAGAEAEKPEFAIPAVPCSASISGLHVTVRTAEQLAAALRVPEVREISLEADAFAPEQWKQDAEQIRRCGKKALLAMPQIFRREAAAYFDRAGEKLSAAGFDAFVVRSLEEPAYIRKRYQEAGREIPPLCSDFQVYGMNRAAENILASAGIARQTLPIELSVRELAELGCAGKELVIAGRFPMMVSAQCLQKNVIGCTQKSGLLMLRDRKGKCMPVLNQCSYCCNTILNSDPLSAVGIADELLPLKPASWRVILTTETETEALAVLRASASAFVQGKRTEEPYDTFTRGSFHRGVE